MATTAAAIITKGTIIIITIIIGIITIIPRGKIIIATPIEMTITIKIMEATEERISIMTIIWIGTTRTEGIIIRFWRKKQSENKTNYLEFSKKQINFFIYGKNEKNYKLLKKGLIFLFYISKNVNNIWARILRRKLGTYD